MSLPSDRTSSSPAPRAGAAEATLLPTEESTLSGPECAGFFLPGLAHQLGNLLLTVQGNALHLQPEDAERARESLLDAVNRGGVSLSVLRAWTGETYSAPQSARALHDR